MAFANFVLKTTHSELGPGEGTPVFAARIDDARLEYHDPTRDERSNRLRTLLARAFDEQERAAGKSPLAPDAARSLADARIREARSNTDLAEWQKSLQTGFSATLTRPAASRLAEFVATVTSTRTRDEYDVDYELVFLGVAARSPIHRRMQMKCAPPSRPGPGPGPTDPPRHPTNNRYAAMGILQATCKISGGAVVGFPEALYPVSNQLTADGQPRFPAGSELWWNALDGVPCDRPDEALGDPYVFRLGRIVGVNYHSVTVVLYPPLASTGPAPL